MYVCTPGVQRSFNSIPNSQRLTYPSSHSKRTRRWPDNGLFMSNYQYSFLHSACLDQLRKESLSGYLQTAWFLYHIHTFTAADAIKQGIEKWGIRIYTKYMYHIVKVIWVFPFLNPIFIFDIIVRLWQMCQILRHSFLLTVECELAHCTIFILKRFHLCPRSGNYPERLPQKAAPKSCPKRLSRMAAPKSSKSLPQAAPKGCPEKLPKKAL